MGMKLFGWTLIGAFACLAVLGAVTLALDLMTARDDMAVGAGILILVVLLATGASLIPRALSLMKRVGWIPVMLALAVGSTGCAWTVVEPGYEGIRVHMVGTDRGVDAYPIVTGRVWYNTITYNVYKFPTFLQRVVWTRDEREGSRNDESFTFRSQEGYSFNIDVGFGYSFIPGQTPYLFEKYRREANAITDGPFRDIVREAFVEAGSQMEGLDILGAGVTDLNEAVTARVREVLGQEVIVEYVNMVGQPRVDSRVEESINAVIEATQRANEAEETVRQRQFEAQQRVEQATGTANALRIEAEGRADAIRIEAEALRQQGPGAATLVQMRSIEKWDGQMPQFVGGGAMPFITVPQR